MRVLIFMDGGVSEHLVQMGLGANAHILLPQSSGMACEVSVFLTSKRSQLASRRGELD